MSATKLVTLAKSWVGKSFHPGVTAQCAAFVSAMLDEAGVAWPHAVNKSWAPDLSGADNAKPIGKRVAFDALVAGDLVFFGNTYVAGTSTHVGVYVGGGVMVHRPTSDRNVETARIDSGYWRDAFEVGVRPSWPAAVVAPDASRRVTLKSAEFVVTDENGKTMKLFFNPNGCSLVGEKL